MMWPVIVDFAATFLFRFERIPFRFELTVGMEKVDVKVESDE